MTTEEEARITEIIAEIVSRRTPIQQPTQYFTILITAASTALAIIGLMMVLGDRFYANQADLIFVRTRQDKALADIEETNRVTTAMESRLRAVEIVMDGTLLPAIIPSDKRKKE